MLPITFEMLASQLRDRGIDPTGMTYREAREKVDSFVTDEMRATAERLLDEVCDPPDAHGRRRIRMDKFFG